jgi:hypothetical protein
VLTSYKHQRQISVKELFVSIGFPGHSRMKIMETGIVQKNIMHGKYVFCPLIVKQYKKSSGNAN